MRKYIDNFFDNKTVFCIVITVMFMMVAHGFCFFNIMYSHDSLSFYDIFELDKVALGRFLYPYMVQRRKMATPWLMGALSTIYVTASVVLVSKIFNFQKLQSACVSVLFSANLALTALFCTYIFDADVDCLALLLACLAVYLFKYLPKGINIIFSAGCMVMCLAIYQAYICVAIGLFILLSIYEADECSSWKDVLRVFINGILEVGSIVLAVIIYIPAMKYMAKRFGVELSNAYNGAGRISELTFKEILNSIPNAYAYFKDHFMSFTAYNASAMIKLNKIALIIIILSLILYIIRHIKFEGSLLIIIPLLVVLPLGLNAIYVVSMGTIHHLMIYAFNIIFLVPFVLNRTDKDKKLFKNINTTLGLLLSAVIMLVGLNNIIYSNGAYTYKKLVYDNTMIHAQTIWQDVNSLEGYVEGETPVVLMGSFEHSKAAYDGPEEIMRFGELIGSSNSSITYVGRADYFYHGIIGRRMNIVYNDKSLKENAEYINMAVYPTRGYCKMIDDKAVVKLS